MIEDFWVTILCLVVVPLVQQGIKLLREKQGVTLEKYQNQLVSFVLTVLMVLVTGDFAGLDVPVWSGDLVAYINGIVTVIGSAWLLVMATYEIVWDRLFVVVKLATRDKFS